MEKGTYNKEIECVSRAVENDSQMRAEDLGTNNVL